MDIYRLKNVVTYYPKPKPVWSNQHTEQPPKALLAKSGGGDKKNRYYAEGLTINTLLSLIHPHDWRGRK